MFLTVSRDPGEFRELRDAYRIDVQPWLPSWYLSDLIVPHYCQKPS